MDWNKFLKFFKNLNNVLGHKGTYSMFIKKYNNNFMHFGLYGYLGIDISK